MSIRDHHSRAYLAEQLFDGQPTAEQILALIGQAMRGQVLDGVFVGGVPERIRLDNASQHLARPVREALIRLRVDLDPINSYQSWENGQHERSHRAVGEEALADLPARTDGPRRLNGDTYASADTKVITFDALADRLSRHAFSYTAKRPHQSKGGAVPLDDWRGAPSIRRADDKALAPLALPMSTRKVSKFGVRVNGQQWSGPCLGGHVGRQVAVACWPRDTDRLEIFTEDRSQYLGFVLPLPELPDVMQAQIQAAKGRNRRSIEQLQREAERRRAIRNGDQLVAPEGKRPPYGIRQEMAAPDAAIEPLEQPPLRDPVADRYEELEQ